MKLTLLFLIYMTYPIMLFSLRSDPIETDIAIFLFDNGDKNMIASMLKYAEENERYTLDHLDFRIIFMGASIDAMEKEPFSHYPEKLIHYKQLGIEETIDHTWKRDQKLESKSLNNLSKNLRIRKKVWVGVSCSIFEQLLHMYQPDLEVLAIRDSPTPDGDTDYFRIAGQVQDAANQVAVPSKTVAAGLNAQNKATRIIGHGPLEEWENEAKKVNKKEIMARLKLSSQLPIIVYAGSYGDFYKVCFEKFLEIVPKENIQVLIVPHPRYKGIVEQEISHNFAIVGEFVADPLRRIKTFEAVAIADIVVTADATSTIVFQSNALGKPVLYVNIYSSEVSEAFCNKKLIHKVSNREEFLDQMRNLQKKQSKDVFQLLGIPKGGAKLLWDEFVR